jgi:hypothetical protein
MVHRRWKPCFSPVLYRPRNRIERFNRQSHSRRRAKPDETRRKRGDYLIGAITQMLREPGSNTKQMPKTCRGADVLAAAPVAPPQHRAFALFASLRDHSPSRIITPLFQPDRLLPNTAHFGPVPGYYRFRQVALEPLAIPPEAL